MTDAEIFEIYLNILSVLALVIVPLAFICLVASWYFAFKYWPFRLPVVMAIVNSLAFPISCYIGLLAWLRINQMDIPVWSPPISAAIFLILDIIPFLTTGYLIWLNGKRSSKSDRRSHRDSE